MNIGPGNLGYQIVQVQPTIQPVQYLPLQYVPVQYVPNYMYVPNTLQPQINQNNVYFQGNDLNNSVPGYVIVPTPTADKKNPVQNVPNSILPNVTSVCQSVSVCQSTLPQLDATNVTYSFSLDNNINKVKQEDNNVTVPALQNSIFSNGTILTSSLPQFQLTNVACDANSNKNVKVKKESDKNLVPVTQNLNLSGLSVCQPSLPQFGLTNVSCDLGLDKTVAYVENNQNLATVMQNPLVAGANVCQGPLSQVSQAPLSQVGLFNTTSGLGLEKTLVQNPNVTSVNVCQTPLSQVGLFNATSGVGLDKNIAISDQNLASIIQSLEKSMVQNPNIASVSNQAALSQVGLFNATPGVGLDTSVAINDQNLASIIQTLEKSIVQNPNVTSLSNLVPLSQVGLFNSTSGVGLNKNVAISDQNMTSVIQNPNVSNVNVCQAPLSQLGLFNTISNLGLDKTMVQNPIVPSVSQASLPQVAITNTSYGPCVDKNVAVRMEPKQKLPQAVHNSISSVSQAVLPQVCVTTAASAVTTGTTVKIKVENESDAVSIVQNPDVSQPQVNVPTTTCNDSFEQRVAVKVEKETELAASVQNSNVSNVSSCQIRLPQVKLTNNMPPDLNSKKKIKIKEEPNDAREECNNIKSERQSVDLTANEEIITDKFNLPAVDDDVSIVNVQNIKTENMKDTRANGHQSSFDDIDSSRSEDVSITEIDICGKKIRIKTEPIMEADEVEDFNIDPYTLKDIIGDKSPRDVIGDNSNDENMIQISDLISSIKSEANVGNVVSLDGIVAIKTELEDIIDINSCSGDNYSRIAGTVEDNDFYGVRNKERVKLSKDNNKSTENIVTNKRAIEDSNRCNKVVAKLKKTSEKEDNRNSIVDLGSDLKIDEDNEIEDYIRNNSDRVFIKTYKDNEISELKQLIAKSTASTSRKDESETNHVEHSNNTTSDIRDKKPDSSDSLSELRHFHHKDGKIYECYDCDYVKTDEFRIIKQHAKLYQCKECEYGSNYFHSYFNHYRRKHDALAQVYECAQCPYKTKTKKFLEKHIEQRHNRMEKACPHCNYTSAYQRCLDLHIKVQHDDCADMYRCPMCGFETKYKYYIRRHINVVHCQTNEEFSCPLCTYISPVKFYLDRHMYYNHSNQIKTFDCANCDYRTKKKADLIIHMRKQHVRKRRRQF